MVPIADSHSDYLAYCVLGEQGEHAFDQGGIERMMLGGVALQNYSIWAPLNLPDRLACSMSEMAALLRLLREWPTDVHLCTLQEHLPQSGIGVVLSIESGESINCSVERIEQFYGWGARMASLTWNFENAFAGGALSDSGLKPHGRDAIRVMNRLNIALDVSHLNEKSFWDALNIFSGSPCASHSSVFEVCPNPRNLRKEQIKAIIDRNGYIGINFFAEFLKSKEATLSDVMDHIEYVLNCGGEDAVGLGSDFCGMHTPPVDLKTVADFQRIPEEMKKRAYPDKLIEKICYGNFARYILQFLKHDTDESI